jgi:hypothetical protein
MTTSLAGSETGGFAVDVVVGGNRRVDGKRYYTSGFVDTDMLLGYRHVEAGN